MTLTKHSCNIHNTFRRQSGTSRNISKHSSENSLYIQVTFIIHSGDIQELPKTFLNIQMTLNLHLGYIHDKIRGHLGTETCLMEPNGAKTFK